MQGEIPVMAANSDLIEPYILQNFSFDRLPSSVKQVSTFIPTLNSISWVRHRWRLEYLGTNPQPQSL